MATKGTNLNLILRWDEQTHSYKRRDYMAVAGKQQFDTTRTKLHPPVIQ